MIRKTSRGRNSAMLFTIVGDLFQPCLSTYTGITLISVGNLGRNGFFPSFSPGWHEATMLYVKHLEQQ